MILRRLLRRLFAPPRPPEVTSPDTDALDLVFDQTRRVYEEQQSRIERITTRLTFVVTVATALFAAGISQLPSYLARLAALASSQWDFQVAALGIDLAVPVIWYRDEIWLAGLLFVYAATVVMAFAAERPKTIAETPEPERLFAYRDAPADEAKRNILEIWIAVYAYNDETIRAKQRRLRWAAVLLVAEALYLGLAIVVALSA